MISLLCIGMAAVLIDLKSGRIPNGLIVTGLGCGLIYQCMENGIAGGFLFAGGSLLPTLLLGILFYYRMIGAGDIKLFCVVGGYVGPGDVLNCMMMAVLFGGIIAVGLICYHRNLGQRLSCLGEYISDCAEGKNWKPYMQGVEDKAKFSFSIPVFLGILCYVGGLI